jgi:hypothetical protein
VIDAWASRDREDYNSLGLETDIRMVQQLITSRLLP